MLIIISPAKKLDFESTSPVDDFTNGPFLKESKQLIKVLKEKTPDDIKKLMKLSDTLAKLNCDRYQSFKAPFTLKNSKQAMFSFMGDTYKGLDALSLSKSDIKYAQKHLRILSGLYGCVAPLDLIQPYRLEMGTKLEVGSHTNLYKFWGSLITDELNTILKKEKYLINLASKEYFTSIDFSKLSGEVITPVFKEKKGDDYKIVGLFAKRARGMMSRYIIQNKISDLKDLQNFNETGYKFSKSQSSDSQIVFLRG